MRTPSILFGLSLVAATALASIDSSIDVGERAKGASKVVVVTVTDVQSAFDVNDFGDRLILSKVSLRADETLKGAHDANLVVTIEGGTVGDVTLEVSDMPSMEEGERAVVFLTSSRANGFVPYRRGAGIMKLNNENRVSGSDLTLDDIRAAVRAAQAGGNQ